MSTVCAILPDTVVVAIFALLQIHAVEHEAYLRQLLFIVDLVDDGKVSFERIVATAYDYSRIGDSSQKEGVADRPDWRGVHDNHVIPFTQARERIVQAV